jgi:putative phage-type endonuclease
MIDVNLFVASKSVDESGWLEARHTGLSATTMAKAMTPAGYREVIADWDNETPIPVNEYMRFGLENEGWLAMWAKSQFGTLPNDWLIRHPSHTIALATPDGLSLDHSEILEVKTTGKDWDSVPIGYRRQVQWQLYVTGAERCHFVWLLREEHAGRFVPGWLEPKHLIIERDEKMITDMVVAADRLWDDIRGKYVV